MEQSRKPQQPNKTRSAVAEYQAAAGETAAGAEVAVERKIREKQQQKPKLKIKRYSVLQFAISTFSR